LRRAQRMFLDLVSIRKPNGLPIQSAFFAGKCSDFPA
jgi:hypothetical protein